MASADGSVVIGVDMNVSEAEKSLERLKKDVLSIEEKLNKTSFRKSKLEEQSAKMAANLDEAKRKLYEMEEAAQGVFSKEQIEEQRNLIKALQTEWDKVENEIERCDRAIRDGNIELEYAKQRYVELEQGIRKAGSAFGQSIEDRIRSIIKQFEEMPTATGYVKDAFKNVFNSIVNGALSVATAIRYPLYSLDRFIGVVLQKIAKIAKSAFGAAKNAAIGFVKVMGVAAKKAVSSLTKALSGLAKATLSAGKSILNAAKNLNVFSKLAKSIGPSLQKLGGMIKRVFVFSVITAGLRAMREKVSEYLSVNAQLKTSLSQLKGSFLTAFNPILESVVPIINTLINVMTRAMVVASQFIATLFGTTAKQAKSNAKALDQQASATAGAGDAAKEASKSLAAFDEINKLDGSKDSGGGAGGTDAAEIEDAFAFDLDDTVFDSWGEAFLYLLDQVDSGIGRLKEAFGGFAVWFNDLNQNLYDMFTFPGVRDKVEQIGVDLADALNFLVTSINWELFGTALGSGLDLALLFLVNSIYAFDWISLGGSLASFVNGLTSQIDWYNFGMLLWGGFKIGLETFAGFLENLNVPEIADAASRLIKGFSDAAYDTVNKINWSKIGQQILKFFRKFDWKGVADSSSKLINKLFEKAHEFITAARIGEIAAKIINFFAELDWARIADSASRLVSDFIGALSDFFAISNWQGIGNSVIEFFRNIRWDEIAQSVNNLVNNFFTAMHELITAARIGEIGAQIIDFINGIDWARVAEGASQLVIDFMNGLADFFDIADWAGLGQRVTDFVNGINWTGVAESASTLVKHFSNALTQFVANIDWFKLGEDIMNFMLSIDWWGIVTTLFEFIGAVFDGLIGFIWGLIKAAWDKLTQFWRDHIEGKSAVEIIEGLYQGITNALLGIGNWIKENIFQPFIDGFKRCFGIHSPSTVMMEMGGYLIDGLKEGLKGIWESVSGFFLNVLNGIKEFLNFDNLLKVGTDVVNGLKQGVSNIWESVKGFFTESLENIKDIFSFKNLKETGKNMVDGLKSGVSNVWSSVSGFFSDVLKGIKEKLSSANLKSVGTNMVNGLMNGLKDVTSKVKNWAGGVLSSVKGALGIHSPSTEMDDIGVFLVKGLLNGVNDNVNTVVSVFSSMLDRIAALCKENTVVMKDYLVNFLSYLSTEFTRLWENTFTFLYTSAYKYIQKIITQFTMMELSFQKNVQQIISQCNAMAENFQKNVSSIMSAIDKLNAKLASIERNITITITTVERTVSGSSSISTKSTSRLYIPPTVSLGPIPALASGSVIPPNRRFLAELGDNKQEPEIVSPVSTMKQAFKDALMEIGFTGNGQEAVMIVDGEVFGRLSYRLGGREGKRIGVSLVEA